jgi:ribosome-binding protein aMBF1 (putative translation factor)
MNDDDKLFDHQDWKKIIINSKHKKKSPSKKVNVVKKNISVETKLNKKIEKDEMKHPYFSKEFTEKFLKKRREMKCTQKKMANILNVSHQIISDIESGKCIYNPQLNNKIKRILNI